MLFKLFKLLITIFDKLIVGILLFSLLCIFEFLISVVKLFLLLKILFILFRDACFEKKVHLILIYIFSNC